MEIVLNEELSDYQPDSFYIVHLVILCSALKYCLGASKSMSFKKLSYLFDKVLKREKQMLRIKQTLFPWDVDGYFRKALILAKSEGYIELLSKSYELTVILTERGDTFVSSVESDGHFSDYIDMLKATKKSEKEFSQITLGCSLNEY
jgi:hypothetical protein